MRFLRWEGKIKHDFEKNVYEAIGKTVWNMNLLDFTRLLLSLVMSAFDDPENNYDEVTFLKYGR